MCEFISPVLYVCSSLDPEYCQSISLPIFDTFGDTFLIAFDIQATKLEYYEFTVDRDCKFYSETYGG